MFGTGAAPATVIQKVVFDQFVYNPLWVCWSITVLYMFEKYDFSVQATIEKAKERAFWRVSVPAALGCCWMIWIPSVSIMYSLPSNLQLSIVNLVVVFNILVLTAISEKAEGKQATKPGTEGDKEASDAANDL